MHSSQLQDVLFEVEIFKTKDVLPQYEHLNANSRVIIDTTHDRILNFCSPQYQLERNADFILPVYKELSKLYEVEVKTRVENHARFFVDLIIKNRSLEILRKDILEPMISLQNSYDNSLRRTLSFGYSRLICTNGLRAFEELGSFERKHTGQIQVEMEQVFDFVNSISLKKEQFQVLTDRQLSEEEARQVIRALDESARVDYPKRLIEGVLPVVQRESQILDQPLNHWLIYNGLNHELFHADIKLPQDQRVKIDKQVLKFLVQV